MSGGRVTRLAVTVCVLLAAADVLVTGRLGWPFDLGFVALCIGVALAVHPSGFFRVGVMPPFLLLGTSLLLAVFDRSAVALANDTFVQAVVSGLAHHSGFLVLGYSLTLGILALRQVARRNSGTIRAAGRPRAPERRRPEARVSR
jgi:hypothetical protein